MIAKELVDTSTLSRDEWLKVRRQGIGGSDIAAILGKNPYESPLSVYMQKLELVPPKEENEFMYFGNVLEPIVAEEFAKRSGLKVKVSKVVLQHPLYPFLLANIDRLVIDGERFGILECKTASAYKLSEWEGGKVPEHYYLQVQHYLGVTGYPFAYIACLVGGNTFRYSSIERDEDMIDFITEKATDFWYNHIEPQIPPEVTYHDADNLSALYPASLDGKVIVLPDEEAFLLDDLRRSDDVLKEAERQNDLCKNRIKERMQEAEILLVNGKKVVTWKSNKKGSRVFKTFEEGGSDV